MAKIKKMQAGGTAKPAKRVGPVDPNGAYTKVQERTLAGAKAPKVPLVKDTELDASAAERKQAGAKMKNGGSLKSVDKAKNPGLSKLPTAVRNKMGYQKNGGATKAKDGKWIQKAIKKPGALRSALGAKKGEPIPAGKLAKAAKAKGKLGQRARLAQTLKRMSKKK